MPAITHRCPKCGSIQVKIDGTRDYYYHPNADRWHAVDETPRITAPRAFIQCVACGACDNDSEEWRTKA